MSKKSTIDILIKYIGRLDHKIELLEKRVETLEAVNNLLTYTPNSTPLSNSTEIVDGIPNCCKGCSNHPSNGGSGICNCTLPYFENPMKWGITCDISNTSDITHNAVTNTYMSEIGGSSE